MGRQRRGSTPPSDARDTVSYLRDAAQYGPLNAPHAAGLRGWWTPLGFYVCATCAARIFARGCSLPTGSTPVWADAPEPYGVCIVHETNDPAPNAGGAKGGAP